MNEKSNNKRNTVVTAYITGDVRLSTRKTKDMVQIKLEDERVFPVENAMRTFSRSPCYLIWALFDCDRKERDEAVNAGFSDEEWDADHDGR